MDDTTCDEAVDIIVRDKLRTKLSCDSKQMIVVRRRHAFSDGMKWFKRNDFNARGQLEVKYIGEIGIDQGGPRRDFLNHMARNLKSSSTLVGEAGHLLPTSDFRPLQSGDMKAIGMLVASILCQRGPKLSIFAITLVNNLAAIEEYILDDVPQQHIREKLREVILSVSIYAQRGALIIANLFEFY